MGPTGLTGNGLGPGAKARPVGIDPAWGRDGKAAGVRGNPEYSLTFSQTLVCCQTRLTPVAMSRTGGAARDKSIRTA